MKRKIFKRALAFCIGGVMALSLAACGDSVDKDEEIAQETTQESEDENIGLVFNDENADPAGNDMAAIPVSANSNGNGSTAPVFKPGAEPQPGQELKPGEEPESGETGTQKPQSNAGAQSSAGSQPATPQSGAGSQQTAPQPTHTHTWVTNTVHHDAEGHYESRVTGTEQVIVGYTPEVEMWICRGVDIDYPSGKVTECGKIFYSLAECNDHLRIRVTHDRADRVVTGGDPIYETQDKWEDVWVQDSAAWDETVTTCSGCGARQ